MPRASLLATCFALVAAYAPPASADACPNVTIVVDNDIPGSGYSETQAKNWAPRSVGACSGTYRYLSHDHSVAPNNDGSRKGTATWQPAIAVAGYYQVTVSYRATENRTHDADYVVHDDMGGTTHRVIDQAHEGDCTHEVLGTFYCAAGGQCRVVLDGTDDSQSDAADATTFTLVSCDDPPDPGVCAGIANTGAYEVCESGEDSCSGVFTDGSGCNAYCAAAGMECVARYGGEAGCQKEAQTPIPCDADNGHASDWCECALPEGGGGAGGAGGAASSTGGTGGMLGAGGEAAAPDPAAGGAPSAGLPDGGASTEATVPVAPSCRAATPGGPSSGRWGVGLMLLGMAAAARRLTSGRCRARP